MWCAEPRSEHASSTQCAVRPLARLNCSAATVPRTGITCGLACRASLCAHSAGTHAEELYGANRGAVRARPTGVSGRARVHARFQRTRVRELRDISENRGLERGNWVHTWSLSEVSVTLPNLNRERKHQPSIVRSDAVSTIGATASWNGRLCASGRCVVARSHHPQS